MVRLSLWLLAGTLALQLIRFPPDAAGFVSLGVLFAVALTALLPRVTRADIAYGFAGVALFYLHVNGVVEARLDARYAGDSMLVRVRVADFPRQDGPTAAFLASPLGESRAPMRMRLYWYQPPVAPRLGDIWQLELKLRRPGGNRNPGTTDSEARSTYERVGARGYVVNGRHTRLIDSRTTHGIARLRQHFVERLTRAVSGDEQRAVLAAIVVGARHLLSTEQWQRYATTGTSHLMAISGLHVGLAAAATYGVARIALGLMPIFAAPRRAALLTGAATACAYAAVSGLAVPAARATLMLLFATAALFAAREPSPARILAAALVALIVVDPLATMAPGFRLSFAAVAVLIWYARRRPQPTARRMLLPLTTLLSLGRMQLVLLAALLPLTVLLFSRVSLAAPAVNLVALPLFSVVTVPLALAGLLLDGPLSDIGDAALVVAAGSVAWLERLLHAVAAAPAASVSVDVHGSALLLVWLPVLWALLPPGWPGRWLAWLGLATLFGWRAPGPPHGCTDIDTLDVGQGLAVVVRTETHTLLYDSGPGYRDGGSAAERIVLPYLRRQGVEALDTVIISHSDLDHAGGTAAIVHALPVADLVSGEPVDVALRSRRCTAGMRWRWDAVDFAVLHPQAEEPLHGNDASCVVLVAAGEHRFLLTGDIEAGVESVLVQRRTLPTVMALTVPHHGSRTSSTTPFVRTLSAELAIVSAGAGNQWGFPKPDVVARWRANGADVIDTATSGAVSLRLCAEQGIVRRSEFRKQNRRLWHDRELK